MSIIRKILPKLTLTGCEGGAHCISIFSNGNRFITGSWGGTIQIWELNSDKKKGKCISELSGHDHLVSGIALFENERKAISSSLDQTLKIWDLETGKLLYDLGNHERQINNVSVSQDQKMAISTSWDGEVKLWDLTEMKHIETLKMEDSSMVHDARFISDDEKIIILAGNGIKIYDLKEKKFLFSKIEVDPPIAMSFFSNKKEIMVGSRFGKVKILNLETLEFISEFRLDGRKNDVIISNEEILDIEPVNAFCILPGDTRAIFGLSNSLQLLDIKTRKYLSEFDEHSDIIEDIKLFPDGEHIVSASRDETLKIWHIEKDEEKKEKKEKNFLSNFFSKF